MKTTIAALGQGLVQRSQRGDREMPPVGHRSDRVRRQCPIRRARAEQRWPSPDGRGMDDASVAQPLAGRADGSRQWP